MLRLALLLLLLVSVLCASLGAPQKADKPPAQQDPKCLLPLEPGPCRMSLDRYYYNPKTNACELFKFGGCRGNDNRFGHIGACQADCVQGKAPSSAAPANNVKVGAGATAGVVAAGKAATDDRNKALKS